MTNQHIDLSFLEQFTSKDRVRMQRYIGMFLESAPAALLSMKQYVQSSEWDQLKVAAHLLKPQITYMGIHHLKETIQRIEDLTRERKNLEELPGLVSEAGRECEKAFSELRDVIKNWEQSGMGN